MSTIPVYPRRTLQNLLYVAGKQMETLSAAASTASGSGSDLVPNSPSSSSGLKASQRPRVSLPDFVLRMTKDGNRKLRERQAVDEAGPLFSASSATEPGSHDEKQIAALQTLDEPVLRTLAERATRKFDKRAGEIRSGAEAIRQEVQAISNDKNDWSDAAKKLSESADAKGSREAKATMRSIEARTCQRVEKTLNRFFSLQQKADEARHYLAEFNLYHKALAGKADLHGAEALSGTGSLQSATSPSLDRAEELFGLMEQARQRVGEMSKLYLNEYDPQRRTMPPRAPAKPAGGPGKLAKLRHMIAQLVKSGLPTGNAGDMAVSRSIPVAYDPLAGSFNMWSNPLAATESVNQASARPEAQRIDPEIARVIQQADKLFDKATSAAKTLKIAQARVDAWTLSPDKADVAPDGSKIERLNPDVDGIRTEAHAIKLRNKAEEKFKGAASALETLLATQLDSGRTTTTNTDSAYVMERLRSMQEELQGLKEVVQPQTYRLEETAVPRTGLSPLSALRKQPLQPIQEESPQADSASERHSSRLTA